MAHKSILALRLEFFVLRLRYVLYQLIIVSLNQLPTHAALLILTMELSHLGTYIYYSIRYKYQKNWLFFMSKLNIGITIVVLCLLSILITLTNWNAKEDTYPVTKVL